MIFSSCVAALVVAPTQGGESRSRRQRRPTRSATRPPSGGQGEVDGLVVFGNVASKFDSDDAGAVDDGAGVDAPHQRAVAGERRRPVVDVSRHHHLAKKLAAAASRRKLIDESAGSDGSQSTSSTSFFPSHAPTSEPARSDTG